MTLYDTCMQYSHNLISLLICNENWTTAALETKLKPNQNVINWTKIKKYVAYVISNNYVDYFRLFNWFVFYF